PTQAEAPAPAPTPTEERVSPVAKRMATEEKVDLATVQGTGARGKITREDVQQAIERRQAPAPSASTPASAATPPIVLGGNRKEERVKLSRRRRTIATRLVEAQQTAAMLTTFNEVDMHAVMELRKRHKDS